MRYAFNRNRTIDKRKVGFLVRLQASVTSPRQKVSPVTSNEDKLSQLVIALSRHHLKRLQYN